MKLAMSKPIGSVLVYPPAIHLSYKQRPERIRFGLSGNGLSMRNGLHQVLYICLMVALTLSIVIAADIFVCHFTSYISYFDWKYKS